MCVRPAPFPTRWKRRARASGTTSGLTSTTMGGQTAVFHARSANPADLPQCYTVEPDQSLTGLWALATNRTYDLSVYGPNGFFRSFKGRQSDSSAKLSVRCHGDDDRWELQVTNRSGRRVTVRVFDRYSGKKADQRLDNRETMSRSWNLRPFGGWYEHVVTVLEDDAFEYRLAGHLETGKDSFSDPLMGGFIQQ